MSSMSSTSPERDMESQQEVLITIPRNNARDRWRHINLILRGTLFLFSSSVKAKRGSITSYGVINTGNEEEANAERTEVVPILPASPELSVAVSCDESTDSNIKLQRTDIERIVKEKDLGSLRRFGGVQGIAEALDTDLEKGIPGHVEDLCFRRISNTPPIAQPPAQGFFLLLLKSFNNCIIFLLSVSAAMSIGFGIKEEGLRTGWYEGAIIILGIIILVVVPSIRDFWRENSKKPPGEQKQSEKKQMVVEVVRGGTSQTIWISHVVFGDIVRLRWGSKVPGDGLFISGDSLKLDDGLATIHEENPFLFHGAKVVNGHGCMLVISVGKNTLWNETMSRVAEAPRKTPLPAQLNKVTFTTQIIGLLIAILIPIVVFLHYKLGKQKHDTGVPDVKGKPIPVQDLMDAIKRIFMKPSGNVSKLTTSLTMLVVSIAEGVPFIVSFAIFHLNKKALSNRASSQDSWACVHMGSVTTICTDKIGGLALNQREVSICCIGEEAITEDSTIDANVLEALCHGISADFLMQQTPENPILLWATLSLGMEMERLKQSFTIEDAKEFICSEEGSRVILRKKKDREILKCLHLKGPAETILAKCSLYYDSDGREEIIDEEKRSKFGEIIKKMHSKDLKTMAFAYKQVDGPQFEENNLILIGMLGLKPINQAEIIKAIGAFRKAGVNIILFSEGNVSVLRDIGNECGLPSNSGGLVIEGEEFRNCPDEERMEIVDKICAMRNCVPSDNSGGLVIEGEERMEIVDKICAMRNCLPSDKLTLVRCLKQKGQIVAMVGFRTNETPALKEANVGIAMGTWSSELAQESSDISILDGNFSSLEAILRKGRCTNSNIQKYIQLEVTMVVAGLLITAITTIAFGDSPITAIQWFWANLVVAVAGGFALLTEEPSQKLTENPPIRQTDSFITKAMWRNIITQTVFQAVMLVTFQFKIKSVLRINDKVSETMIFNSFILCQVFNLFSARELQMMNVFKGIHRNIWFWVAVSVALGGQLVFIETAHILAGDATLNGEQWGICFLIGILSLAVDFVAKCTSTFIMNYVSSPHCSEIGSMGGVTHSKSISNLELPLIKLDSAANP